MAKGRKLSSSERETLVRLAELGGSRFEEEDIIFEGDKLIVPQSMTLQQVRSFLDKKIAADEEMVDVHRSFHYRPWDGAYATWQVFKRVFGALGHKGFTHRTLFGGMVQDPPQYITIQIGPGETEEIPWGVFSVPLLERVTFICSMSQDEELGSLYTLHAKCPRKDRSYVEGIFALIEAELLNSSIYRGKAFDGKDDPNFLDLDGVDPDKVVYSAEAMVQLEANIWSVMRHTQELRKAGIPRKRSALLYGPYGTGKTLAGFLTAQVAVDNGWTCVYVRPGKDDLETAMQTARLYQPAVVFAEDLDAVAEGGDISKDTASRILDVFDGITAKGTELMVVLTTNHPERIHKAMLRPGRLDAVINISGLDKEGIAKLVRVALPPDSLSPDVDWDEVGTVMEGMLPAYVREAADRAFRYSLTRNDGSSEAILLTTEDLVHAANGLQPQLELMADAKERKEIDPFHIQIRDAAKRGVVDAINEDATTDGNWMLRREAVKEANK